MNGLIFVHIAAYRDAELIPTVLDCIANASNPSRLRFGIAWQHAPDETLGLLSCLNNVRILDIPHTESKGACWARAMGQTLYNGEEFYLQLDSHHRFAKNWDDQLLDMLFKLERAGIPKPVITGYTPGYEPKTDPVGRATGLLTMGFRAFDSESVVATSSNAVTEPEKLDRPFRARFLAAGLIFARGAFVTEVPYDPHLYFYGEELNLGIRAFTHGWELFHPHKILIWHYYTREGKPKHWTDHKIENTYSNSLKHLKMLLSLDGLRHEDFPWGPLGFGTERTLQQWERYTGISLSQQRITVDCLKGILPVPNWESPIDEAVWQSSLVTQYEHTLEITAGHMTLDDYDFIYVGFDAKDGTNIHAMNISGDALKKLVEKRKDPETIIPIKTNFFSQGFPHRWAFWPHSKSKGWTQRLCGNFPVVRSQP